MEQLTELLNTENVIFIQGPAYSGKTSLLQLLQRHYKVCRRLKEEDDRL
jgi:predicted AAA+ superfamily ATPase